MSLLRRAVTPTLERRASNGAVPFGNSQPPTNGQLGYAAAGTTVTENTALAVAAVYGSVGLLSDALSTLPLTLISSDDPGTRKKLPLSPLLQDPYSEISRMDWLVQYTISLALRGNFFGQIISRDANLFPTQIKPVHPDHAKVSRMSDGSVQYQFYGKIVPTGDVFHVRYLSVADSLVGMNPIDYLRNAIGLARAAELYGGSFFANSAMPSGVIELEEDWDEDEIKAFMAAWRVNHQGLTQGQLPAVLTGGAKWETISLTPDQAQFLATRQFSQMEICGTIFRVPPHMIGIVDRSTSWGTGIEQQELGFVRNTLGGYTRRLEEALSALHPPNQYVRFDYNERLRGDKPSRYQAYQLGISSGFLCADDIRLAEDLPPVPDSEGQNFFIPINGMLLDQALHNLENPPPPPVPFGGMGAAPAQPADPADPAKPNPAAFPPDKGNVPPTKSTAPVKGTPPKKP